MIITKTPVRLPIAGGGTDLPEFYQQTGFGYTLSLTINKFVFCLVRRNFEKGVRFTGYYKKEIVNHFTLLENPMARAVLQYLDFQEDIEIITISDIRTNCGLGTSSSFVVGLIHALKAYRGEKIIIGQLAKDAIEVERNILKEKGGIQDQYAVSLGGLVELEINKNGYVNSSKLEISTYLRNLIEERFVIYDTKVARISSNVQAETVAKITKSIDKFNALKDIYGIGKEIKDALLLNDVDKVGSLMNDHWIKKKIYSEGNENLIFDHIYYKGLTFGAIGGKLMGAGGGGYFMFIARSKSEIKQMNLEFQKIGLIPTNFKIDDTGTEIIFKGNL
jgi:D-glycero-alpha-D-manno-heptose-7-phosphate kinase